MTAPDLPAELKTALEARLHGLSRVDAAGRAGLRAGADARDLCRSRRKPERAP
jgi:hypothetical protein